MGPKVDGSVIVLGVVLFRHELNLWRRRDVDQDENTNS